MDSAQIRNHFLTFFEERGHTRVPSSSLVPNDPTLLFTNAGMNQFKPYFTGEQEPPYQRAVTVQKCLRAGGKHNDLEEVGRTTRHLTFFEMLGNFSFGEYFKAEACPWAWELITERWGMDPERLWITVFDTDDDAYEIWRDAVGVPAERIIRMGMKDNYWHMGIAGPCGPCSEIHYDRGDGWGEPSSRGPADNDERYVEFWNLVFMQNECDSEFNEVGLLPKPNIDTGAGLERIAMLLQDKPTLFESDMLYGMIEKAAEVTGKRYGRDEKVDFGLRVLGDHGRAMTFAIADGVLPSNEERGYVLRRIMRRAMRHARLIGYEGPLLPDLVRRCVDLMGDAYPEISSAQSFVEEVTAREEERFASTLKQGSTILDDAIADAKTEGAPIPGTVAFQLHDTYGFPIDLTIEIASESGVAVDADDFRTLMDQQRERARAARGGGVEAPTADALASVAEERGPTEFVGYEHLTTTASIIGIADGERSVPVATQGQTVDLVLDRTPFYAEGGGQVGDRGTIEGPDGSAGVVDTKRLVPGLTGHRATIVRGDLKVGDEVTVKVDPTWRVGAQRAHTATHVLHWALRDRLGEHATQAGSLVEPGRLRFDFHHFEPLGDEGVAALAEEMQGKVMVDDPVRAFETSFDYAKSIGAMAMFGEKYGDFVRVVEVGDYSKELCGGTHVAHTSQIGVIVVTGEGSVGANLRRVEALVGAEGIEHLARRASELERTAELLRAKPEEVAEKVERLLATQKEMEKQIAAVQRTSAESDAEQLAGSAVDVDGTRLVVARRDVGVDDLRSLARSLKGKLGSAVIVLGTAGAGRANLVGAVTKDLVARGVSARDILAPGAQLLGGGAGGKPDLAVSGGPSADNIERAIEAAAQAARAALES